MNKLYFFIFFIMIIIIILLLYLNKIIIENYEINKILIHKIVKQPKMVYNNPPGLGDILKGTLSLFMISKKNGYNFYLDLSEHPIGKYINTTIPDNLINLNNEINEYFIYYNISDPNILINEINKKMEINNIGLFETNCEISLINNMDDNDRKKLQEILKPNEYLENKINIIKNELKLYNYSILHIRSGDDNMEKGLNSKIIQSVEKELSKINLPENVLLLSDSNEMKQYLHNKYKYNIINSDIIHLGSLNSNNIESAIESTLIDFFLICGSNKIYSLSVYDWNSGFSGMASKLYNISIEKYKI